MQYLANHFTHLRATCYFSTNCCRIWITHAPIASWQIIAFLEAGPNVDSMNVLTFAETIILIAPPGRDRNLRELGTSGVSTAWTVPVNLIEDQMETSTRTISEYSDITISQNHSCKSSNAFTTQHCFGAKDNVYWICIDPFVEKKTKIKK